MSEFGRVCKRRKLRVNVRKSKVMRWSRYGNEGRMHVILNGDPLEEVDWFRYLGSQVAADGRCERHVVHRMNEEHREWGALKSVLSNGGLGIKAKKCVYGVIIVQTALYGAEAWGMRSAERRKVNVLEIKCLKTLFGVSRMDRVRNEVVRRRARIERELLLVLLKEVFSTRLRGSDIHPISPKTSTPQYQSIDRKKRKVKIEEDYYRDRAAIRPIK